MIKRALLPIALLAFAHDARAAKHPRFEPTDLEIEKPGTAEVDVQFGPVRGPTAWRVVVPDFELDLGLLDNVELDLDGAYAVEGVDAGKLGPALLDHQAPDNLWPSVRVALGDWHNRSTDRWFALGVQGGPKIPIANGASGIGFEGLLLLGFKSDPARVILNVGGIVDPRNDSTGTRPVGVELGADIQVDLVPDHWAAIGELGGIFFTSNDAHQLAATAGIQWSANEQLDFSVVALVGFASGSDPFGVLFGVSPKLAVW
jgi:hypothetical protein